MKLNVVKIVFILGSAEPGKDGVGDYTRRLCGELLRRGHEVQMLSLCDHQAMAFVTEEQWVEGTAVTVNRIPKSSTQGQRLVWTQKVVDNFAPNWISLQFVPYSFNPKGLPFWLPSFLKKINGNHQWHIMFHELWIGISIVSPVKHKITGFFQRAIVKKLILQLKLNAVTTSNVLYQYVLQSAGITADLLHLFSNIPKLAINESFRSKLLEKLKIQQEDIQNVFFAGVFGSIYPEANIEKVLSELLVRTTATNKRLVFISFGRIGVDGEKEIKKLETLFAGQLVVVYLGELSQEKVSTLFQLLDIGISCTPLQHIGKSGVFAAMKLHELEVHISSAEELTEYETKLKKWMPVFMNRPPEMWSVHYVADNFTNLLINSKI